MPEIIIKTDDEVSTYKVMVLDDQHVLVEIRPLTDEELAELDNKSDI